MQEREGARGRWRKPRIRFGVRALMAIVFVAACGLGWIVQRAHEQRDTVDALRRAGFVIYYEWRILEPDGLVILPGKAPSGSSTSSNTITWALSSTCGRASPPRAA